MKRFFFLSALTFIVLLLLYLDAKYIILDKNSLFRYMSSHRVVKRDYAVRFIDSLDKIRFVYHNDEYEMEKREFSNPSVRDKLVRFLTADLVRVIEVPDDVELEDYGISDTNGLVEFASGGNNYVVKIGDEVVSGRGRYVFVGDVLGIVRDADLLLFRDIFGKGDKDDRGEGKGVVESGEGRPAEIDAGPGRGR